MNRYLLTVLILLVATSVAAEETAPPPCSEPEARQFDFWVGEWEVHAKGKVVGHNQISRIHGGTRLHLQGRFADGQMIMSAERAAGDKTATDRITWTDNPDGTVRQAWDVSEDGGNSWKTIFDGFYKPLAGSPQEN